MHGLTPSGSVALLTFDSGPPWQLRVTLDSVGRDYLCRIEGGERHIGAMALAQWRSGRVHTEHLVVNGHKEAALAIRASRELCRVSERSVTCIAGIHFDDLDRRQIDEIVRAAEELIRLAVSALEPVQQSRGKAARIINRGKKQPPSNLPGG